MSGEQPLAFPRLIAHADPENEEIRKKIEWTKGQDSQGAFTVPTTIQVIAASTCILLGIIRYAWIQRCQYTEKAAGSEYWCHAKAGMGVGKGCKPLDVGSWGECSKTLINPFLRM